MVVQEAERLGYDSVWAAEAYGSDTATVLAWLAAGTATIKLGSAIFQIPARSPALAGEIADGWLPIFFSPEHVSEVRGPLEEGAARSGRSLEGFDMAPTVNTYVSDDVAGARDRMRPFLALYIGGMGSREQNFYNQLVQRYGFEDAAVKVQNLYLDGKKDEAAAALPDELIDLVTLCGPRDPVRDRLAAFRDA